MKPENYILASLKSIKKEPAPKGMSSREIVARAIEFRDPPRLPYYFLFHPTAADMAVIGALSAASAQPTNGKPGDRYVDKWGVTWEVTGHYWDHAVGHPLTNLDAVQGYKFPNFVPDFKQVKPLVGLANMAKKYVVAWNPINMYEQMRSLMGFEELMMAPYSQPDGLRVLLERLTCMTIELVDTCAALGFHGFMEADDWGLQTSLQMKLSTFREFYRPFYQRIIDACHRQKMHFIWHSCGYIVDLFDDMIEMGVDVLQLDQPRLMGYEQLIARLGGRICMWSPLDIQWSTSEGITDDDIRREVAEMMRVYDIKRHHGGFIAKHYANPWDIELSPERQQVIHDAFMENGGRLS